MKNLEWFCFGLVVISLIVIVFYMMVNTSESESEENPECRRRRYLFSSLEEVSDPDEWMALNHHNYSSSSQDSETEVETDAAGPRVDTPLQFGMYHVYLFMQGCFQRLRHLMATDHSMQGRGYAILPNLLRILRNYERHGITSGEADHMTVMHRSINEMESVLLSRGGSVLAIQDEGQGRMYQDFSGSTFMCAVTIERSQKKKRVRCTQTCLHLTYEHLKRLTFWVAHMAQIS